MYCSKCGSQISQGSKFCTKCGNSLIKKLRLEEIPTKKTSWHMIIITAIVVSIIWFFIWVSSTSNVEKESVSIISALLETVGRQGDAWANAQKINELVASGLSSECIFSKTCFDEVVTGITQLKTINDKESQEIERLWSTVNLKENFASYYKNISAENQRSLNDVLNQYFPEQSEDVKPFNKLLSN